MDFRVFSFDEFDDLYTAAIRQTVSVVPLIAISPIIRGTEKIQRGDRDGALDDYTAAIALPHAPAEPVARALFNRGVMRGERGDRDGAIADYTAVITLPEAYHVA